MNTKTLFQILGCLFILCASQSIHAQSTSPLTLNDFLDQATQLTSLPYSATGEFTDQSVWVAGQEDEPEFGRDNHNYHAVAYKMTLTQNSKIVTKFRVISGSDTLRTMLYLYKKQSSATGGYKLIKSDYDGDYHDKAKNVFIIDNLEPGEYYWAATIDTYESVKTGSFEFHLQNFPPPVSFTDMLSSAPDFDNLPWQAKNLQLDFDSYYVAGQTNLQFGIKGFNYFAMAYKMHIPEKKYMVFDINGNDPVYCYVYLKNQDGSVTLKGKYIQPNFVGFDAGDYYFVFASDTPDAIGQPQVTLQDAQLGLWVNGEDMLQATNYTVPCGNGTAIYNPDENTLTLNNAEITKTNFDFDSGNVESGILIKTGTLKLILEGTNTINVIATKPDRSNQLDDLSGIYLQKAMAWIGGTGSLDIATSGHLDDSGTAGVLSWKSTLTIESGTLNLIGGNSTDTISYGYSLDDSHVIIRGGTGSAQGNKAAFNAVPQFENTTGITSGNWNNTQCQWGANGVKPYGVYANGEEFNSSKTTITCGNGTAQYDPGNNRLVLNNATIQNSSELPFSMDGPLQKTSMGIAAMNSNSLFEIVLKGTNTIQQTTSTDAVFCVGIYVQNNLNIRGDGALNVTAGNAYATVGILSEGINIESGAITAIGGGTPVMVDDTDEDVISIGILAYNTFTQAGGYVNAQGGTTAHSGGIGGTSLIYGGAGISTGNFSAFSSYQNHVFGPRVSIIDGAPEQTHCSWESAYTLSFDLNGGDGVTPDAKTVTFAQPIGTLPTPNKTGVHFAGWKAGNDWLTDQTIWNYNDDQTAVAQWNDTPTNVQQELKESVSITPNPATEWVKIQGISGTVQMQILNLDGRVIRTQDVSPDTKINVSTLSAGVYLVRIHNKTLKLVVN